MDRQREFNRILDDIMRNPVLVKGIGNQASLYARKELIREQYCIIPYNTETDKLVMGILTTLEDAGLIAPTLESLKVRTDALEGQIGSLKTLIDSLILAVNRNTDNINDVMLSIVQLRSDVNDLLDYANVTDEDWREAE